MKNQEGQDSLSEAELYQFENKCLYKEVLSSVPALE